MKRNIITIDEGKCNGCGLCASACHEGAIRMIDGKARLISESYCDGLGACLPACPTGAITIEEREAAAFDEAAVAQHIPKKAQPAVEATQKPPEMACGCPGTMARAIERPATAARPAAQAPAADPDADVPSQLRQWPCQIQLVNPMAPYLRGAHLLVAADCTAYANANVHQKWIKGRITMIGCPKLDDADYAEKLSEILVNNDIQSITVLRMSVPCCGGIVQAVKQAMLSTGTMVPWQVVTIDTNGDILK